MTRADISLVFTSVIYRVRPYPHTQTGARTTHVRVIDVDVQYDCGTNVCDRARVRAPGACVRVRTRIRTHTTIILFVCAIGARRLSAVRTCAAVAAAATENDTNLYNNTGTVLLLLLLLLFMLLLIS